MNSRVSEIQELTPDKNTVRLVGIELRSFSDGTTLALTPSNRLYQIQADPSTVAQLLQECNGSKSISEILSNCVDPVGISEVINMLLRDGCLCPDTPMTAERDWTRFDSKILNADTLTSTRVVLIGDEHLISISQNLQISHSFDSVRVATFESLEEVFANNVHVSTVIVA